MQMLRLTARLALFALVLAAACKKSSDNAAAAGEEHAGATATETAEPGAEETVEPSPVEPEEGEPVLEDGREAVGEPGGDSAARLAGPADENRDLVAVGANKIRIVPLGTETVADNDQYTVKLKVPGAVPKGDGGKVEVLLTPKKGWKLNREFPTKLTVEPPSGVQVAKKSQGVDDAVTWDEKKGASWAVAFKSASTGKKEFTGKFKFAVCTEESCIPKGEDLAFSVKVK